MIRINADSHTVRQKEETFGESGFFSVPSPRQTQGRCDLNSFNAMKTPSDPYWIQMRRVFNVCVGWGGGVKEQVSYFAIPAIQE